MLKNCYHNPTLPTVYAMAEELKRDASIGSQGREIINKRATEVLCKSDGFFYYPLSYLREIPAKVYACIKCEMELLQPLVDDPEISEIMVNGTQSIFIERHGVVTNAGFTIDTKEQLKGIIQRIAAKVGREMNDLNPILDARLSDGSRINAVNDNIAIDGPLLCIRKFGDKLLSMSDLLASGGITEEESEFLIESVINKKNIFISGGTSSGKTTFLNILSEYIPEDERIVVIEDSAELKIRNHSNCVRMEAKAANVQGKGAVSISDLIKTSLRLRPDRIIVGEVRGEEVISMLAAMSTGHEGSLSTGHANSARGMIGRLETLHIASSGFPLSSVRSAIADAIDIIVQLKRFPDGSRRVVEISEIEGICGGEIKLKSLFYCGKKQV